MVHMMGKIFLRGNLFLLFAILFYSLWSVSLVTALRRQLQRWKFYNSFQVGERDCLSYTSSVSTPIRALDFGWCQKRTKWACGAHALGPQAPRGPKRWNSLLPCYCNVSWSPLTWPIVHNHTQYASNNLNKNTTGFLHHLHNFHTSFNMGVY